VDDDPVGRREAQDAGRGRPALGLLLCATVARTSCGTRHAADGQGAAPGSLGAPPPAAAEQGAGDADPELATVHPVTTVVVTDDPAVVASGSSAEGAWPGLLAARLESSGSPLTLTPVAVEDAGFAAEQPAGPTFTELVMDTVSHSTQLVVFYDSRWGPAGASEVTRDAEQAFSAVEEMAPDALVVVVGPWQPSPEAARPDATAVGAVQAAVDASVVAVTYVDPVADGWPTGASQEQIADLVYPHVSELVAALANSGAFD
jgi:hypothetical protein